MIDFPLQGGLFLVLFAVIPVYPFSVHKYIHIGPSRKMGYTPHSALSYSKVELADKPLDLGVHYSQAHHVFTSLRGSGLSMP